MQGSRGRSRVADFTNPDPKVPPKVNNSRWGPNQGNPTVQPLPKVGQGVEPVVVIDVGGRGHRLGMCRPWGPWWLRLQQWPLVGGHQREGRMGWVHWPSRGRCWRPGGWEAAIQAGQFVEIVMKGGLRQLVWCWCWYWRLAPWGLMSGLWGVGDWPWRSGEVMPFCRASGWRWWWFRDVGPSGNSRTSVLCGMGASHAPARI